MNVECTKCGLLMSTLESNPVTCIMGSGHSFIDEKQHFPCPLTNSSHEKALVRVVEKRVERWSDANDKGMRVRRSDEMADFIQVLCSCGHILSECEVKNK